MGEIDDLAREWSRHLRSAILRALSVAPSQSLNESILRDHINGSLHFKATREQVRDAMRFLDREGMARIEGDELLVLEMLQKGLDFVEGRIRHRDIKSPSRD